MAGAPERVNVRFTRLFRFKAVYRFFSRLFARFRRFAAFLPALTV